MPSKFRFEPQRDEAFYQSAEGVAAEALSEGDLCYVSGRRGNVRKFSKAISTSSTQGTGPLWVAAFRMNSGVEGRFVPWKDLSGVDTSGTTVGDPVYLSAATAGAWTAALSGSPVVTRQVGSVAVVDATDGVVTLDPAQGTSSALAASGSPVAPLILALPVSTTGSGAWSVELGNWTIIDAWAVMTSNSGSNETWTLKVGADTVFAQTIASPSADDIFRAETLDTTYTTFSNGTTVQADFGGAPLSPTVSGTVYVSLLKNA